jgi:hypothetical protein
MEDFTLPNVGTRFKKWELLYIHSSKLLGPSPNILITLKSINQKIGKKTGGRRSSLQFVRPWAATGR